MYRKEKISAPCNRSSANNNTRAAVCSYYPALPTTTRPGLCLTVITLIEMKQFNCPQAVALSTIHTANASSSMLCNATLHYSQRVVYCKQKHDLSEERNLLLIQITSVSFSVAWLSLYVLHFYLLLVTRQHDKSAGTSQTTTLSSDRETFQEFLLLFCHLSIGMTNF